ncbi:PLC-like phosphodiesterase [Podospora aff. communis PSN243]|uniref:Phosphoinositide phospholipase C n=1 Tax=Podospora aff. communis PSN243 TaxID=3040156 RepID=A0AAV9H9P4_9PEZI|nr:PLC-like phosphodiesterase [Podospora aff. communis PSN243]
MADKAAPPPTTSSDRLPATADSPHQAGGGVSGEERSVKTLHPTVLSYLKALYSTHVTPAAKSDKDQAPPGWTSDDAAAFLKNVQRQSDDLSKGDWGFDDFIKYMTSSATNVVAPPHAEDASWPLSSYFISSSHNTYLTGNQLYSDSSADAYKNVLLRGCRCIEIDVWDGDDSDSDSDTSSSSSSDEDDPKKFEKRKKKVEKVKDKIPSSLVGRFEKTSLSKKLDQFVDKKKPDAAAPAQEGAPLEKKASAGSAKSLPRASSTFKEPRVLHGYTLTKEVLFRDVCNTIRDYGFVVTDLPLIVSLEVHCSPEQQEAMVHIMEEVWGGLLLPKQEKDADSLPAPGDLRGKILVKVKYAPPEAEEGSSPADDKKSSAKPSKIIQALSKLGIYTRGVSFKSLTQPEATMPTHIFSLSENGVTEVHQKSARELFNHNKNFLMRAYPSGLRIGSSNLDPAVFWRKGIQIVALNWQNWDEGMMLNEGMFAGTGGYVLKPGGYRSDRKTPDAPDAAPQATAVRHYNMDLTIEVLAAQNLPCPPGDTPKSFNPYLKVEVHVEEPGERHGSDLPADGKEKEGEYKAKTKTYKGCDPDYKRQELKFKKIPGVVPELSFVRFLVRDDQIGRDALAAWACVRLDRLREGYRFVHLLDWNGMETEGVILVRVSKTLG